MISRAAKVQALIGDACCPSARKDRSRLKRRQIIDAAGALFLGMGYGTTSVDAIAAKAGVSKRTVYAHFDSKEALFIAVMDRCCADLLGIDPEEDAASPIDRFMPWEGCDQIADMLTRIGTRFLDVALAENTVRLFRVVVAEAERFPELGRLYHEVGPKRMLDRLAELLQAAQAAGHVQLPEPAEEIAWRFVCDLKDPHHFLMALGVIGAPDAAEKKRLVERAVARFMASVNNGD